MTSFDYRSNPRYAINECSSCGTLYTRDCVCSIGTVEDKILVPKPLKNCARCTRAPDSPNQFHCFHCKDVLRDGEACKRCTCIKCGSGLGKGLCYICGHNQNSLNDSPSISETSSQSPPNINHCCYECGDPLDGIFCKRCTFTPTEPVDSLSMGDEHLDTIPATELDEFVKSCVEKLVPNPSESEGTTFSNVLFDADYDSDSSDDQSLSDEDVPEKIYSNPLFDEEIIPMEIDQHSFNTEPDLIESMPNHDSSIIISSKIDSLLDEFAGELTLLKSFSPGIDETDCHPEEELRFAKRLLYNNSSPRPTEEFVSNNSNADIESFSPSPIPNEDSDSHIQEIDLYFNPDDPMPPGIEEDDDDSERDMTILDEFPDNSPFHFLPMSHTILIFLHLIVLLQNHQMEKSLAFLSHLGFEAFQPSAECPMIINGKNTPVLDVPLFHFYPLDQL
nr:hypothetical protein [Tanacetum cinerariifolium]